jgi:hypothetical protein
MSEKHLKRVRRICSAFPETTERLSHGEPTFFVRKKVFAMFSNNHHNDGHISVLVPAAPGVQGMLIEGAPEKFLPATVCRRGRGGSVSNWRVLTIRNSVSIFVRRGAWLPPKHFKRLLN